MNGFVTSKSAPSVVEQDSQPHHHPSSSIPFAQRAASEALSPPRASDDFDLPQQGSYREVSDSKPRPHSTYSLHSLASNKKGGRVQLAGSPTLGAGGMRASTSYHSNQHHHLHDQDAQQHQQEEILDEEREAGRPNDFDPYAWERPLDTVNRHSRMLDIAPVPASPAESTRRLSRMPNAGMLDPFGFSLSAEPSPYDSALAYSNNASTRQRASFLGPPTTGNSLGTASPYPSTSSMGSIASGSSYPAASTGATSWASGDANVAPGGQPWLKQRSASMGESTGNKAQIRASLSRPGNRSKLSGEINADTQSLAEVPMAELGMIPKEADYANSKLYQRTLKAQKALEKERAKAAAKGKVSKFDLPDKPATSSLSEKRQSSAGSFMSDMPLPGRRSRSSLGWFRSSSEATLPLPPNPSFTPPLPTSRSVSQLPLPTPQSSGPPSPNLEGNVAQQQQQQQQQPRLGVNTDPNERLRAYRASVGGLPSPRATSPGDARRQRHMSEIPRQNSGTPPSTGIPLAAPRSNGPSLPPSRNNSDHSQRQSPLLGPRAQPSPPAPHSNGDHRPRISPRSTPDVDSNGRVPRAPSPLSAPSPVSQPPPPRTDSIYLSSKEPSFDQERPPRGRPTDRAPSPSPPSSESSPNSPITPRSESTTGLGLGVAPGAGPSLPPGAAAVQGHPIYGQEPVRKRKSSLNLLMGAFGGGKKEAPENEQAPAQRPQQQQQQPAPSRQGPPPVAAPIAQPPTTPKKLARTSFFSRNKEPTTPGAPSQARLPSTSAPRAAERAPAPPMPRLPRTSNTSESTFASSTSNTLNSSTGTSSSSRLGKSKPSSGGGFFSFGRSRSKTVDSRPSPTLQAPSTTKHPNSSWNDLTNTLDGARGLSHKNLPPQPSAQVASRNPPPPQQRQQAPPPAPQPKKKSRWGSSANDGYHPAPPPARS